MNQLIRTLSIATLAAALPGCGTSRGPDTNGSSVGANGGSAGTSANGGSAGATAANGGSAGANGGGAGARVDRTGVPIGCADTFATPASTKCDGILLTAPEVSSKRTDGIVETTLPSGLTSYRFAQGHYIDLKNEGCTQLAQDNAGFSLSMWLKAPLGTGEILRAGGGFSIALEPTEDGLVRLNWVTSGRTYFAVRSVPFDPEAWTHVILSYTNKGDGASGSITVNGTSRSGVLGGDQFANPVRLGSASGAPGAFFEVADVKSHGRALNSTEIRAYWLDVAAQFGRSATELADGIGRLREHFSKAAPLEASAFAQAAEKVTKNATLLPTREALMLDSLALLEQYEASVAPFFLRGATAKGIAKKPDASESAELREARIMLNVFQSVYDEAFRGETIAACRDKLRGRRWETADYFPGKVSATLDPERKFTVKIDATVPPVWGIPVAFATHPKMRPTGLYLPPGSVGKVTVPPALVDAGFAVQVGAHSWDHSDKPVHTRMHRTTRRIEIRQQDTYLASPLGGGVYIEVPYLASAGLVEVQVQGVVEAPFFSLRKFDSMTAADWQARRTAGAPWADFVSDYFMLNVPSNWVYSKSDPTQLLKDWDVSMQGVSEFVGIAPEKRNEVVLWAQVDTQIPGEAHGIGYPQVNNTYGPLSDARGDSTHPVVTSPLKNTTEFHELGHSQLFSKFRGEVEALVNFPIVYSASVKFGQPIDEAFRTSFHGPGPGGFTPDNAAIHWMVTVNFGIGAEMDHSNTTKDEMRYQERGYAKYADIARLFGWKALTDFYRQENLDYMAGKPGDGLSDVDSRILRLSVAAGADLTPLIHFWGIHPVKPDKLKAEITAKGLQPSAAIKTLLARYRTLIPANKAQFDAHFEQVYPGMPAGDSPDYASGWYHVRRQQWDPSAALKAQAAIDALLAQYFP